MMRRNTIAFLLAMLVCMAGMLWVAPHLFSSVQAQDMQRMQGSLEQVRWILCLILISMTRQFHL